MMSVEVEERWRNGRNRRPGSLAKNVVLDTANFMRPGARESHLGQGSSSETGYVDADQLAI